MVKFTLRSHYKRKSVHEFTVYESLPIKREGTLGSVSVRLNLANTPNVFFKSSYILNRQIHSMYTWEDCASLWRHGKCCCYSNGNIENLIK